MYRTLLIALVIFTGATAKADFTYTQTTQITGGSLYNLMRMAGRFSKSAREPIATTHIVKGNRMASITRDEVTIIDLDKGTITTIDNAKKQYSVVTFAQMKQAMEEAMAKAQARKGNESSAEMKFDISAKATGKTKTVNGLNAKEMQILMETQATTDKGDTGSMFIGTDTWLANVPGYDEVKQFQRKMGQKMGYLFGSGMAGVGMAQPQSLQGFAKVSEEMAKVEGVPVEQFTKMGPTADGVKGEAAPPPPESQQKGPGVGAAATGAAVSGALGRIGIGGFGRKKNDAPKEAPEAADQQPAGNLMEMTTELSAFSSGPADASKFEVPAGYKQVDNPMVRRR